MTLYLSTDKTLDRQANPLNPNGMARAIPYTKQMTKSERITDKLAWNVYVNSYRTYNPQVPVTFPKHGENRVVENDLMRFN